MLVVTSKSGHAHLRESEFGENPVCGRSINETGWRAIGGKDGASLLDVSCGRCLRWIILRGYMTQDGILTEKGKDD